MPTQFTFGQAFAREFSDARNRRQQAEQFAAQQANVLARIEEITRGNLAVEEFRRLSVERGAERDRLTAADRAERLRIQGETSTATIGDINQRREEREATIARTKAFHEGPDFLINGKLFSPTDFPSQEAATDFRLEVETQAQQQKDMLARISLQLSNRNAGLTPEQQRVNAIRQLQSAVAMDIPKTLVENPDGGFREVGDPLSLEVQRFLMEDAKNILNFSIDTPTEESPEPDTEVPPQSENTPSPVLDILSQTIPGISGVRALEDFQLPSASELILSTMSARGKKIRERLTKERVKELRTKRSRSTEEDLELIQLLESLSKGPNLEAKTSALERRREVARLSGIRQRGGN